MQTGNAAAPRKRSLAGVMARNVGRDLKRLGGDMVKSRTSYLFLAPFFLIFLTFTIIPVIMSIGYSFTYFNILEDPQWVGWDNYVKLFLNDDIFVTSVKNTLIFAVITGPVGYLASFVMAWLINEQRRFLRVLLTVMLYAPALSGQAYVIWNVVFSGDIYGYANGFLMNYGLINEPIQWLTDTKYMMGVCIFVVLWLSLGTNFLIFVAGLQTVPVSYYEAALIDGIKNRWQELWYITLPQMKPQLMIGAVMTITSSFAVHDQLVPLVGFPSTDYAAHTVVSHLVDYGTIRFDMGYASAIATVLFLFMVLCNKAIQFLLRKVGK